MPDDSLVAVVLDAIGALALAACLFLVIILVFSV